MVRISATSVSSFFWRVALFSVVHGVSGIVPAMAQPQPPSPQDQQYEVIDDADDDDGMEDLPDEFVEETSDADQDGIPDSEDMDYYAPPEQIPLIRVRTEDQQAPAPGQKDVPYSIGGSIAADRQVPWQAQIYGPFTDASFDREATKGMALWQKQHVCGGSLISSDWVLTAAHCINTRMVNQFYRIKLGAEDISKDPGVTYRIDRIVRHAGFDNMYRNDIALVHIVADGATKPSSDPRQVSAITTYTKMVPAGAAVAASGWGRIVASNIIVRQGNDASFAADGNQPNAVLLQVDLNVIGAAQCQNLPGYEPTVLSNGQTQARVHAGVICAAKPGKATCRGDSGGPLVVTVNGQAYLAGIVSWGKGRCTGDGQPGVYTSVFAYRDWIRRARQVTDPAQDELP